MPAAKGDRVKAFVRPRFDPVFDLRTKRVKPARAVSIALGSRELAALAGEVIKPLECNPLVGR